MSFFKKDNIKIFLVLSLILVAIVILFSISILNIQYKSYKSQMYNSLSAITSVLIAENSEKEVEIINAVKSINENEVENGKKILAKYGIGENSTIEVEQIGKIINQNKAINILIFVLGFSLLIVLFVVFLALRERKIKNITQYLKDLQNNIYSLKIEENTEGELSELQNQIVKITIMLNKQAETMKKDKKELSVALSDISHQIKTPLTSINIMLDIIKEDEIDENLKREYLHQITKQLDSINWLITVILKLSRLESGMVEFAREDIDVKILLEDIKKQMAVALEIKNQNLYLKVQANCHMIGDYNWTKEALTNIVKNCIEHTAENKNIYIEVEENCLYLQIIIKDEGEGISKEDLPNIFKRFYKGKDSSKESFGIGLALAKTIIEKQNGEIRVQSKIGEGTQFRIRIFI